MQFALVLKSNYLIGLVVTEATCKTLVTQRMKSVGMRWNIKGGQGNAIKLSCSLSGVEAIFLASAPLIQRFILPRGA